MSKDVISPGHSPAPPFGVHVQGNGVTVAVLASRAAGVDFCLIDPVDGTGPGTDRPYAFTERRIPLTKKSFGIWHDFIPGVKPGQRYGFRTRGSWDPRTGLRHNPAKLLIDPYTRGFLGELRHSSIVYGYVQPTDDHKRTHWDHYGPADDRNSLTHVPHSVVLSPRVRKPSRRPKIRWSKTVIYEAHLRGLTMNCHFVPPELRGTYAGLAHPQVIEYLKDLGITTIELLPIQAFLSEPHLLDKRLTNYWGYNTFGFFAPHAQFATKAAQLQGPEAVNAEVRSMIDSLHAAGLEVILDVVYNHTSEGGDGGLHIGWRGLDNLTYYLHDGGSPARLANVTGTGNALDFRRPRVIQMALDSLRYWIEEFDVDGFRFDLAVTLGRQSDGYSPDHPFLVAAQTDPVISQVKLIAEPWDVGPGGWQTGNFPAPFTEWNDRFRNAARGFWLSDSAGLKHGHNGQGIRDLATRLAGSADIFGHSDPPLVRGPVASINFITAHDGFTLNDLVTYNDKHNFANGENGRDGNNDNQSWNHGIEGPVLTTDESGNCINTARKKSIRNLLGTLLLAAGTPMITAGDEFGRTQLGNNNAYCQDNPISWVNWRQLQDNEGLHQTAKYLLHLRREHPALHVDNFFHGRPLAHDGPGQADLTWYDENGDKVNHQKWHDPSTRAFQMLRRGRANWYNRPADPHVLWVINGQLHDIEMKLAGLGNSTRRWWLVWDSEWQDPREHLDENYLPKDQKNWLSGDPISVSSLGMQLYLGSDYLLS